MESTDVSNILTHSHCSKLLGFISSYQDGCLSFTAREFNRNPAKMENNATEPRIIAAVVHDLPMIIRSWIMETAV